MARIGYSVKMPLALILPILPPHDSLNQSALSGPAVIESGRLPAVGIGKFSAGYQRRHSSNPVPLRFREPEIAVRASGDPHDLAGKVWDWKCHDGAPECDPPDVVVRAEPKIAIGAGCDPCGMKEMKEVGESGTR